MLDRLEDQGQIERIADASDSRKRIVRATEKNRALHASYDRASAEMNELFYAGMSEAEIDRFEKSLRKILANLEKS